MRVAGRAVLTTPVYPEYSKNGSRRPLRSSQAVVSTRQCATRAARRRQHGAHARADGRGGQLTWPHHLSPPPTERNHDAAECSTPTPRSFPGARARHPRRPIQHVLPRRALSSTRTTRPTPSARPGLYHVVDGSSSAAPSSAPRFSPPTSHFVFLSHASAADDDVRARPRALPGAAARARRAGPVGLHGAPALVPTPLALPAVGRVLRCSRPLPTASPSTASPAARACSRGSTPATTGSAGR